MFIPASSVGRRTGRLRIRRVQDLARPADAHVACIERDKAVPHDRQPQPGPPTTRLNEHGACTADGFGVRCPTPVSFESWIPRHPSRRFSLPNSPVSGRPSTTGPILYKGEELNPERGPGLGCFRFQLIVLVVLIILTPLSVEMGAPPEVSAVLLFIVLGLLLLTGQTIIFLLRLVAAERRGRRRPLASGSPTVGEIEEAAAPAAEATAGPPDPEILPPA